MDEKKRGIYISTALVSYCGLKNEVDELCSVLVSLHGLFSKSLFVD